MENEQFNQINEPKTSKFSYLKGKLKSLLMECWRVLQLTKKPGKDEFKIIIKVSLIGIALIGLIGFVVQVLSHLIKGLR